MPIYAVGYRKKTLKNKAEKQKSKKMESKA